MKNQIVSTSRMITGATLIAAMMLTACDEAITLSPDAVNRNDSCSRLRAEISAARRTELDQQASGAAVGAFLGAIAGAAVAGSNDRAKGALIGAAAGGLIGYSAVYARQVEARSKDANTLLRNVNSDAGKERALVTRTGRAALNLQKCRRGQLASLRSRVKSGKVEKPAARAELRTLKAWVAQDNRIVSAAFNGIGKRVDAYVDVTNATAKTQRSISTSSARARTPNVSRVKSENSASVNSYNRGQEAVQRDIQVLDVLLG